MLLLTAALALSACKKEDRPPAICNDSSPWSGGQAFEDRSTDWGLDGMLGVKMSAADLDGDGFPDLVVNLGTPHSRDDLAEDLRYRWVLMNEDDGSGHRVLVDRSEESGLFTIREDEDVEPGGDFRASQVHVFGDVDNDGDLDAFAGAFTDANNRDTDLGDRSELLLNDGSGHFSLVEASDLQDRGGYSTSGASFADVDADGDLDLWVTGWYKQYGDLPGEQDMLFEGDGTGTFDDETEDDGLEMERGTTLDSYLEGVASRPAYGGTACDLNGDAMPDLLASNYGRSWNQQWMNQGDGTFVDVAMESGFAGDDDLTYVEDQFYACYCKYYGPCDPDPGTPSISGCETYAEYWTPGWDDQPARLNGNSFTTACGDIDNDGDNDLITAEIRHWHIGAGSDHTELLINDGSGNFSRPGNENNGLERVWEQADWNEGDLYVSMADIDNDGWKDIVLITSDYPYTRLFLFHQLAPGQFEEVAEEMGIDHPWPAGMAIADFDRDGDLDVITGSSTARSGTPWDEKELHFYENQLGSANFVRIALQGSSANRAGIGAMVDVTAGGITQSYEVGGGFGHFGIQNDTVLTVGLGDACEIDEVTVTWPGGAADSYTEVPVNYGVTLVQGGEVVIDGWPEDGEE